LRKGHHRKGGEAEGKVKRKYVVGRRKRKRQKTQQQSRELVLGGESDPALFMNTKEPVEEARREKSARAGAKKGMGATKGCFS